MTPDKASRPWPPLRTLSTAAICFCRARATPALLPWRPAQHVGHTSLAKRHRQLWCGRHTDALPCRAIHCRMYQHDPPSLGRCVYRNEDVIFNTGLCTWLTWCRSCEQGSPSVPPGPLANALAPGGGDCDGVGRALTNGVLSADVAPISELIACWRPNGAGSLFVSPCERWRVMMHAVRCHPVQTCTVRRRWQCFSREQESASALTQMHALRCIRPGNAGDAACAGC